MKKKNTIIFNLILIMSFIGFLFGCGKKDIKFTTTSNQTTSQHTHQFGEWSQIVKPTCTEEGIKKRTCQCGEVEYDIIEKVNHTYVDDMCSVCGYERLTEGFNVYYSSFDELYHIDNYEGSSTTVRIPYKYDDGTNGEHKIYIDKISVSDSYESKLKNADIKRIIIGNDYEYIPENMFLGLNNLEEVVLPKNLKSIKDNAFYNCPKLSKITFNSELEQICFYAFACCAFKELKLPYSLRKIDVGAFSDNDNLEKITYNNSLVSIGDNALNNTALDRIKIPYTLTYFGFQGKMRNLTTFEIDPRNSLFEVDNNCLIDKENNTIIKALNNATIPNYVDTLAAYSFSFLDYSEIDFVIPSNIKYIGFNAFKDSAFKSLSIEEGLLELDESAFYNTVLLNADTFVFSLPTTLISLGSYAFKKFKCKEVIIPVSIESIGNKIFIDSLVGIVTIHKETIEKQGCSIDWDKGIDTDVTTINIIDD